MDALRRQLYIFWFLHQTTTRDWRRPRQVRCISFDSYIKPQLRGMCSSTAFSCISFDSYIKPQRAAAILADRRLYIFWFLHQTTTLLGCVCVAGELYIFWFLHQTTTIGGLGFPPYQLYIFWFLHQTTTASRCCTSRLSCISFDSYIKPQHFLYTYTSAKSCISFDSYIKPQLLGKTDHIVPVVYLLIPTSNHNRQEPPTIMIPLYIFWFLHQTTTLLGCVCVACGCISFDSYIKPQRSSYEPFSKKVVYLLIPTSNHNILPWRLQHRRVVYLLIPTSNHNKRGTRKSFCVLYIFWFLHQTTTDRE